MALLLSHAIGRSAGAAKQNQKRAERCFSFVVDLTSRCNVAVNDRWLTMDVGVTAIPPSAFYIPEHKHLAHNLARFAYCKTDESIEEAKQRLATLAASK